MLRWCSKHRKADILFSLEARNGTIIQSQSSGGTKPDFKTYSSVFAEPAARAIVITVRADLSVFRHTPDIILKIVRFY